MLTKSQQYDQRKFNVERFMTLWDYSQNFLIAPYVLNESTLYLPPLQKSYDPNKNNRRASISHQCTCRACALKNMFFCVNKNKFFEEGIAVLLICTRMFATPLTIKMRPPSPLWICLIQLKNHLKKML